MRPFLHRNVLALGLAAGLVTPAVASAVTLDEIVSLTRAGVTETVILALIDRDKTIFTLEPEQLVTLKAQGVSEAVILAMLKSGREEGDRAAQMASDLQTALYLAERSPGPELLIVGPGPDVPDPGRPHSFFYSGLPAGGYLPLPYIVDGGRRRGRYIAPVSPPHTAPYTSPFHEPAIPPMSLARPAAAAAPALCRAEVSTATSTVPLTTIVECPPVFQVKRAR